MTYEEIKLIQQAAWSAFFTVVNASKLDGAKLEDDMDGKDCFNDVWDCFMNQCSPETEEDE